MITPPVMASGTSSGSCADCPAGSTTAQTGSTSQTQCIVLAGYYGASATDTALSRCSAGYACPGGGNVDIAANKDGSVLADFKATEAVGQGGIQWKAEIADASGKVLDTLTQDMPLPVRPPAAYQSRNEFNTVKPGETKSFENTELMCFSTARSERPSAAATEALLRPCAISASTSDSRGVRNERGESARRDRASNLPQADAPREIKLRPLTADQIAQTFKVRAEEKSLTEQLERASKESLQATVLAIAKTVEYDKPDADGNPQKIKLSDAVKFQNASEVLAELTQKRKGASNKKKHKKGQKEVFLATIECVFNGVPDTALDRFMARVESHPDSLFGIAVDISRNNPSRDAFAATLKIGQFRFGTLEE